MKEPDHRPLLLQDVLGTGLVPLFRHLSIFSSIISTIRIGGSGAQPDVLHRTADGEMVEALPVVPDQTERTVQHIIEVATDAGAANPGGLGSQIEGLTDQAGFPKQFPVGGRPPLP